MPQSLHGQYCGPPRPNSRTEPLASARASGGKDLPATFGRHPRAKTVAPFTHEFAGLIGSLHGKLSALRGDGPEALTPGVAPYIQPRESDTLTGVDVARAYKGAPGSRQCDGFVPCPGRNCTEKQAIGRPTGEARTAAPPAMASRREPVPPRQSCRGDDYRTSDPSWYSLTAAHWDGCTLAWLHIGMPAYIRAIT